MADLVRFFFPFSSGTNSKNLPANAGKARDSGSISGLGRSPGVRNDTLLQYGCLENSMGRGAWWATVHWVTKQSDMAKRLTTHTHTHTHTHTDHAPYIRVVFFP